MIGEIDYAPWVKIQSVSMINFIIFNYYYILSTHLSIVIVTQ